MEQVDLAKLLHNYEAKLVRVIDGDTIELMIDVGFYFWYKTKVRLLGVDTPEIKGETRDLGLVSKAYVEEALGHATDMYVHTEKGDSFGRWLAELHYEYLGEWNYLNVELLDKGLAAPYVR